MKLSPKGVHGVAEAAECVVVAGDCSTVRQPRVKEVSSGKGDVYYVKFYQRAARLLYHRVLEMMGGLVDKIHISCCAVGMRRFVAHHACWPILTKHNSPLAYISSSGCLVPAISYISTVFKWTSQTTPFAPYWIVYTV